MLDRSNHRKERRRGLSPGRITKRAPWRRFFRVATTRVSTTIFQSEPGRRALVLEHKPTRKKKIGNTEEETAPQRVITEGETREERTAAASRVVSSTPKKFCRRPGTPLPHPRKYHRRRCLGRTPFFKRTEPSKVCASPTRPISHPTEKTDERDEVPSAPEGPESPLRSLLSRRTLTDDTRAVNDPPSPNKSEVLLGPLFRTVSQMLVPLQCLDRSPPRP